MRPKLKTLLDLSGLIEGEDGIFSSYQKNLFSGQEVEMVIRENWASRACDDYLGFISRHHSIPVMDAEVSHILSKLPFNALILDIGGCQGWHWRNLNTIRPDIIVVIVDFVRKNLLHAKSFLGPLVGDQVLLVHANALALPFPSEGSNFRGFDAVWTVQVFQHIPKFEDACFEAFRVLSPHGIFMCFSLQVVPLVYLLYRLLGRNYHIEGEVSGLFYLARANLRQRKIISKIFGGNVTERYSEHLFNPELKLTFSGRERSIIGRLDAYLGRFPIVGRWIARQRSYEVYKKK
jgi:ubiquinone/menaquinone biosynthesis C-methylase UbiE